MVTEKAQALSPRDRDVDKPNEAKGKLVVNYEQAVFARKQVGLRGPPIGVVDEGVKREHATGFLTLVVRDSPVSWPSRETNKIARAEVQARTPDYPITDDRVALLRNS